PLREVAAVILADIRRLPDDQLARLARFVGEGGGLMIVAADQTGAEAFSRWPRELLPATLLRQHDLAKGGRTAGLTLPVDDWTHPILRDFGGQSAGGLLTASFQRFWDVEVEPGARTILRYANGSPALIERQAGRSRVLLWTSSTNMSWNNLA